MKPYPAYKPTGLKWLPEVPRGWDVLRCKNIFTVVNQRSAEGKEKLLSVSEHYGVIERSKADVTMFMAESYAGYKLCWPDDLVINSLWAWSYGMGFSHDHGIISTAYSVYRLKDKSQTIPAYYNYLVRGTDYHWEMRVRSKGLWKSRYQLSDDDFMSAPILIPPPAEQRAIVACLDAMTVKIDRLIKLKEREIELLQEKKQVVISTVVTRGLDPNVKLVDSGVAWIGKMPKDWKVAKLRRYCSSVLGKMLASIPNSIQDTKEKYICAKDVHFDGVDLSDLKEMYFSPEEKKQYLVQKGDLLIVEGGAGAGGAAIMKKEMDVYVQNSIHIVRAKGNGLSLEFLCYWLFTLVRNKYIDCVCNKATIPHFTKELVLDVPIPVPPIEEQRKIVAYLDAETAKTDRAIAVVRRQIELLREYRTRLISDAVTGRIDLREAVA